MSDDDEREDSAPKTGELIRKDAPLPIVAPTGQQKTLRRILSKLSIWPFNNRMYVKALKTAKEVFDARNELGEAIGKHEEIQDRLKHFEDILARGREERSRQLYEEKERRRAAENIFNFEQTMQKEKNRQKKEEVAIQGMEQEKRALLLKKELDELRQPPPPPPEPPKKPSSRARSEKQKLREMAYKRYEKEIERIEAMKNATPKTKVELKKTAQNELEEELQKIDPMP